MKYYRTPVAYGEHSPMWAKYQRNLERSPFKVGQKVRYLSANADQTIRLITWVSAGATCRGDQLVTVSPSDDKVLAAVFVDACSLSR